MRGTVGMASLNVLVSPQVTTDEKQFQESDEKVTTDDNQFQESEGEEEVIFAPPTTPVKKPRDKLEKVLWCYEKPEDSVSYVLVLLNNIWYLCRDFDWIMNYFYFQCYKGTEISICLVSNHAFNMRGVVQQEYHCD